MAELSSAVVTGLKIVACVCGVGAFYSILHSIGWQNYGTEKMLLNDTKLGFLK